MKRSHAWWATLTPPERSELRAIEKQQKALAVIADGLLTGSRFSHTCPVCHRLTGTICLTCLDRRATLVRKADRAAKRPDPLTVTAPRGAEEMRTMKCTHRRTRAYPMCACAARSKLLSLHQSLPISGQQYDSAGDPYSLRAPTWAGDIEVRYIPSPRTPDAMRVEMNETTEIALHAHQLYSAAVRASNAAPALSPESRLSEAIDLCRSGELTISHVSDLPEVREAHEQALQCARSEDADTRRRAVKALYLR